MGHEEKNKKQGIEKYILSLQKAKPRVQWNVKPNLMNILKDIEVFKKYALAILLSWSNVRSLNPLFIICHLE